MARWGIGQPPGYYAQDIVIEAECRAWSIDENGEEHSCTFLGEVDATAENLVIFWQCPKCGANNEEEAPWAE